jgi:hypothetical protein
MPPTILRLIFLSLAAAFAFQAVPIRARRADALILLPGPDVKIAPDQKIAVTVQTLDDKGNVVPTTIDTLTSVTWRVNGHDVGAQNASDGHLTVTQVMSRATFTAPHVVPTKNPVAVSVSFKAGASSEVTTLVTNVTVVDQGNYFTVTGPAHPDWHTRYQLNDKGAPAAARRLMASARPLGAGISINVNPMEPREEGSPVTDGTNAHLSLLVSGGAVGNYDWSAFTTSVSLLIAGPHGLKNFSSLDCRPHGDPNCNPESLPGTTTILSIDPAAHEIRGFFSGMINLYQNGQPSDSYSTLTGQFVVAGPGGL